MQEHLFDMLLNQDEITWQSMIYDLVREEKMDPWDINITLLAQRFLEMLKKLKSMDFRISGKVLLAAAILLRLKSNRLVGEDLAALDRLISSSEELAEEFYDELEQELSAAVQQHDYSLTPRTPQPRKRKVSVYDLVAALNKALEVKNRRAGREILPAPRVEPPKDHIEISVIIEKVFDQIREYYNVATPGTMLKFSQLLPAQCSKQDKVYTFIPLLHLDHQRKIELWQKEHFGEIEIELLKQNSRR
ncbi:segregation/condensation protein A [Candidatus Woesearchaeota archaeon]|nr:segregation/condensation protein A [Candidatus Woesearchaeota archaeon]